MVHIHNRIFFPLIMLLYISSIIRENEELRSFELFLHAVQCRLIIFLCADIAKHFCILRLKIITPANMHTDCMAVPDLPENLLIGHSLLYIHNLRKTNQFP